MGWGRGWGVGAGVRGWGVVAETAAVVVVSTHSQFPPICFRDDTSAPSITQRSRLGREKNRAGGWREFGDGRGWAVGVCVCVGGGGVREDGIEEGSNTTKKRMPAE